MLVENSKINPVFFGTYQNIRLSYILAQSIISVWIPAFAGMTNIHIA